MRTDGEKDASNPHGDGGERNGRVAVDEERRRDGSARRLHALRVRHGAARTRKHAGGRQAQPAQHRAFLLMMRALRFVDLWICRFVPASFKKCV